MHLTELAYFTPDVNAMTDFYRHLLGTEPIAQSAGMAIFNLNGVKIFIHQMYTPAAGELPPSNHIAFTVPNVDAACTQLAERGLTLEVPPQDYYWGRSAYLRDPAGHQIELTQNPSALSH